MDLQRLAQTDPEALHALVANPETPGHLVSWGAEYLGAKWTPDRWWPTLLVLLCHAKPTVQEGAMNGLTGSQSDETAPHDFYAGRDWPADVATGIHADVLATLDSIAASDPHTMIREMAAEVANQLRTGEKYPE